MTSSKTAFLSLSSFFAGVHSFWRDCESEVCRVISTNVRHLETHDLPSTLITLIVCLRHIEIIFFEDGCVPEGGSVRAALNLKLFRLLDLPVSLEEEPNVHRLDWAGF